MENSDLKIGATIYYKDADGDYQKTTVKNMEDEYVNYCECEQCVERIGTDQERYKFDNAIHIKDVYTDIEAFEKAMHTEVSTKVQRLSLI